MRIRLLFLIALLALRSVYADVTIEGILVNSNDGHYLKYVRHMTVPFASQSGAAWEAGNDVSGRIPAEVQIIVAAIRTLETSVRQREIFDRMKIAPTETFAFRDIAHAKSTVLQRLETVAMMTNFNLDSRYAYHDKSHPVSTTAAQWEIGSQARYYFRQKSGTAYEAITQLCDPATKTYGECLGAIIACVWWGASRGMGEDSFNSQYSGTAALNMDFRINISPRKNIQVATDASVHVPGDWLYFKNHNYTAVIQIREFYKKGWLDGETIYYWSGENSLYFGADQYEGLGVTSRTAADMREEIRTAYNRDLATVIDEVGKSGGVYDGIEIKIITREEAETKITTENVLRLTN